MELEALVALAKSLPPAEFAKRFPHLFFLHEERAPDGGPLAFHTEALPGRRMNPAGTLRLLPVVKAPESPYIDRVSIGRARNCDVVLRDASVSKLHAHVRSEGTGWVLTDLGSHNGTKVAGVKLTPQQPVQLRPGAEVVFGSVAVRVADAIGVLAALRLRPGG
jgi:hypothetical protein